MFSQRRRKRSGASYRLILDESEVGNVSVVGGLIVSSRDAVAVTGRWQSHKQSMGLPRSAELKFNMPTGDARNTLESAGYPQRTRLPVALETVARMPIHLVASVNVVSNAAPRSAYLDGLDWCVSRFRDFVASSVGSGIHQVMVDQPSGLHPVPMCTALDATPADSPFALYSARWSAGTLPSSSDADPGTALSQLGFAPELVVGCSTYSDLLQVADHIVGCTAQFAARHLDHPNEAWWKDENFCRIASRFWRGSRHLAVAVTPEGLAQAKSLESAIAQCAMPRVSGSGPSTRACCGRAAVRSHADPATRLRRC